MKKILYILLILPFLTTGQTVKESFSGWGKVASVTTTPTDTTITLIEFSGSQRKFNTKWLLSNLQVGDVIWASSCSRFVVKSRSGLDIKVSNPDKSFGAVLPTNNSTIGITREYDVNGFKIAAIPQFGDGSNGAISGTNNILAACMSAHYLQNMQSAILAGGGGSSALNEYANDAEAAANGVPIGSKYILSQNNTMGGIWGDEKTRKN
jgi:hypothetical protein